MNLDDYSDEIYFVTLLKSIQKHVPAVVKNGFNMGGPVHSVQYMHSSLGGYLLIYKAQKHYSFFEKL